MSSPATRAFLSLFALISIQATTPGFADERPWKMATTPNYRLISQASDRESAAWMRDFDQFILSTSDVLKLNLSKMPPLTVVIFDRDKDYDPYKLLKPNGETANVARAEYGPTRLSILRSVSPKRVRRCTRTGIQRRRS